MEINETTPPPVAENGPDLTIVPDRTWHIARRRLEIIAQFARSPQRTRSGARQAAEQLGCSIALIYRLLARYDADPRLTSFLPRHHGRVPGQFQLEPEVEDLIRAAIDDVYLTRQRPSVTALVRDIQHRCQTLGLSAPSRKAVRRRLSDRSAAEVMRRREGRKRARDRFAPAIGSVDAPRPLSLVQIDHTLVDIILVDSVTRAPIRRPWLTLAIDVYSRCILGSYLSLDPPSATSVALCIAHAALPKDGGLTAQGIEGSPPFGVPEKLHLDNGRDFHSDALRRGCEQYNIAITYRPVRTPHYGGHIERLIGTMMGKVHLLAGTTFSNVQAKGDSDPTKTATLTLPELEEWLVTAINGVYHQELHRGLGITPLAAWRRGTQDDGGVRIQPVIPDPRRFLIDFLPIERRLVRREGVFLHSIAYWSSVLTAWIGDATPMIVRYDPRDLSRVYLLGPDDSYHDLAYRDVRRPAISLWEHRAALKHLREKGRRTIDESAIFEAVSRMRRITEQAATETRSMRHRRERQRHWSRVGPAPVAVPADAVVTPFAQLPSNESRFANVEDWS